MSEYNPVEIQMSTRYDSELMTKKTPASKEEELLARKKCKKCSLFYNEATTNECHYHPGVFMEPTGVDAMVGWSCCRVSEKIKPPGMPLLSLLNDNALKKDSKGCTKAEKHVEDDTYSVPASQFPFDYEEYQKKSEEITAAQPEPATPVKPEDETKNAPPGFYRHKIVEGDTLVGLSLKYKIPLDTLKKVNHLFSHQIFHLKEILIPITEEFNLPKLEEPNPQKEATKAFKRKTGASLEEAKFYLEESNWNVETAIKEYEQDTKYEKEQLANNNKPVGSRDVSVKSPKESRFKIFARKTVIC